MDPNTTHQLWSEWTFRVRDAGRNVSRAEMDLNTRRWLRLQFGSVGVAQLTRKHNGWRIKALVESADLHEPRYVEIVKQRFDRFVSLGFGPLASGLVEVKLMAGEQKVRGPRAQLLVIPRIELS